eukprot:TCALIF_09454-PA protein Name:"Similar to nat Arylamine N-acetyltransferase (Mycobacterium smegmatis)" AED:0.44 eAED:0.44 QI:0/0.25/0.2/1/0.5/0.6/5/172/311
MNAYLNRIGFECGNELPPPTTETLQRLQKLHQLSIPWENLDVVTGVPIDLSMETLYSKIVVNRRGGWCHELNCLYSWLLKQLGFDVTLVSSRFWVMGSWNREGDHMLILVKIPTNQDQDLTFISDVGWGEMRAFVEPLPLEADTVVTQINGHFRLMKDDLSQEWTLFNQKIGEFDSNAWTKCCKFTLQHSTLEHFQEITRIYANGLDEKVLILKELPIIMKKSGNGSEANIVIGGACLHFNKIGNLARKMVTFDLPLEVPSDFGELLFQTFDLKVGEGLADKVIDQIQRSGQLMAALSGEKQPSNLNEVLE